MFSHFYPKLTKALKEMFSTNEQIHQLDEADLYTIQNAMPQKLTELKEEIQRYAANNPKTEKGEYLSLNLSFPNLMLDSLLNQCKEAQENHLSDQKFLICTVRLCKKYSKTVINHLKGQHTSYKYLYIIKPLK
jgi:hypothetical protein